MAIFKRLVATLRLRGASGHHHRGSPPLPLPARHERGEGHLHRIGAANWNPLSLTLSTPPSWGEGIDRRMVVVSRCASAWDPQKERASGTAIIRPLSPAPRCALESSEPLQ